MHVQNSTEFFHRHLLQEKLILGADLAMGHAYLDQVALHLGACLNCRPVTLSSVAEEIAAPALFARNQRLPLREELLALMAQLLDDMWEQGDLKYFALLYESVGLPGHILELCKTLRLSGIRAETLDSEAFVDPVKGHEVRRILAAYEKALARHRFVDSADLLHTAINYWQEAEREPALFPWIQPWSQTVFIVLPGKRLAPLEREFYDAVVAKRVAPGLFYRTEAGGEGGGRVKTSTSDVQLPAGQWVQSDCQLSLHRAYGSFNEARRILDDLLQGGFPLDQATVYPASATAELSIYQSCQRYDVPVVMGGGIPALSCRGGRVAGHLARWFADGFLPRTIWEMLLSGDLQGSGLRRGGEYLRQLNMAPGPAGLTAIIETVAATPQQEGESGDLLIILKHLQECVRLAASPRSMCAAIATTAMQLVRRDAELPLATSCCESLRQFAWNIHPCCSVAQAAAELERYLQLLRLAPGNPEPGKLFVARPDHYILTGRPRSYFIGYSAEAFPGTALSDPLLLDGERRRLSPEMPLSKDRPRERLSRLRAALANLSGHVSLSYASFNTCETRGQQPSPVLLQLHRQLSGNMAADYADLAACLPPNTGFVPDDPRWNQDDFGWCLAVRHHLAPAGQEKLLREFFPGVQEGTCAAIARQDGSFNHYTGNLSACSHEFAPAALVSPTRLERYAKCPFRYFLHDILGLYPSPDLLDSQIEWLDPASRGSLLHRVFQVYGEERYAAAGKASLPRLRDILSSQLALFAQDNPPPSPEAFTETKESLVRDLSIYYQVEEELAPLIDQVLCEAAFGDEAAPIEIELPSGRKLGLHGTIDRIDLLVDGTCRLWDFKTGSTFNYSSEDPGDFAGGTQLQLGLYAIAAREVLCLSGQSDPRIVEAGYIFPTEKGQGEIYRRQTGPRQEDGLLAVVDLLLEMLEHGTYCMESGDCRYCDYQAACDNLSGKTQDGTHNGCDLLAGWKGLKEIDR